MNKNLVILTLLAAIFSVFGCKKDNPITDKGSVVFSGTVVDTTGAPIESVGVHFIMHFNPPLFSTQFASQSVSRHDSRRIGTAAQVGPDLVAAPSTNIMFNLPTDGIVTLILTRQGQPDFVDTLIANRMMSAGSQEAPVNPLANGVYHYHLWVNGVFIGDHLMILNNVDVSLFASVNPLVRSNKTGGFQLPYQVFGGGTEIHISGISGGVDTAHVTNVIDLVLTKPGFQTSMKTITLDTTTAYAGTFIMKR